GALQRLRRTYDSGGIMSHAHPLRTFARVLAALLVIALLGVGFAFDLPRNARLALHDEHGRQIGHGEVDDDEVELEVLRGAAGFATLTITTRGGGAVTYDVLFGGDGQVLVV